MTPFTAHKQNDTQGLKTPYRQRYAVRRKERREIRKERAREGKPKREGRPERSDDSPSSWVVPLAFAPRAQPNHTPGRKDKAKKPMWHT